jgi:hypothetical protein
MYKTESVLGLIGSIIGAVVAVLCLAGSLLVAFFFNAFESVIHGLLNNILTAINLDYNTIVGLLSSAFVICMIVCFAIAAASFILGFIGTSRLRKGERSGGVLLIIAGVLAFISVYEFIPLMLFLIGGIMAVSKKQPALQ